LCLAGAIAGAENLTKYDSVDADVIQSYSEYSLASLLYYAMKVSYLDYLTLVSVADQDPGPGIQCFFDP
jgi:hypothetical protein